MNSFTFHLPASSIGGVLSFTLGLILCHGAPAVWAGSTGQSEVSSIATTADNEIARRQFGLEQAEQDLEAGRKALRFKEYEAAYIHFLNAVEKTPPGIKGKNGRGPVVAEFSAAAMLYAEWLVSQGRYTDAEQVAKTILLPEFNPDYRPAVRFLSNLEQPDYFNKTVTPAFAQQQETTNQLFREAEGFYASGRFDLATKRYNQILEIDPYNSAARQGMEKVDNARQKYFSSAYNETRSRMLWEVTQAWNTPVPPSARPEQMGQNIQEEQKGTEAIQSKLNRIIIPRINLNDTTLREALNFLQQQSVRLDTSTQDEGRRGVNMVLRLGQAGAEGGGPSPNTRISLNLSNVPLSEALRYVAEMAGLRVRVEPFAVSLVPLSEPSESLSTKEYRVPPGFIPPAPAEQQITFARRGEAARPQSTIRGKVDAQKFLEESGISFPEGASATYLPAGSKLIVRNTPDNIELIDRLIEATGDAVEQVEIEAKFVEVSQNDLNELGFEWLLGPVAIGGGTYLSGGDASIPNNLTFPFSTEGQSLVTSGLRSGSGTANSNAISSNSIPALLAESAARGVLGSSGTAAAARALSGPAPAIFGVGGIFTNPQFQVLIRALNQKKGIDLMASPKVTTPSGREATIKIARQMFYPTIFDPPVIPTSTTTSGTTVTTGGLGGGNASENSIPPTVTPSFPSGWTPQDIGVLLTATPTIGADSYTIDLSLTPQVIDFDGFIDYGSPINGVGYETDVLLRRVPQVQTLTQNRILQPIFSQRKVTTDVTVWDGQTVSLGGLMREDIQKVEDKVPLLGDIPLAGRLFRSNVDQKIKKNLIIFVTATIIGPDGQPIRRDFEEEDVVEPLGLPQQLPGPQFPAYKGGGIRMK